MRLPAIDLSGLIKLLKSEGRSELAAVTPKSKFGEITAGKSTINGLTLFSEWDNIILILEKEVIPLLSKGCDTRALLGPAQRLGKSVGSLSLMASQVLSFIPGPIGIICSIVNAIVCFSTGNVVGGLLELLGCIPGGKVAGKAASKLFPKIEKILIEMVQSNHALKIIVETSSHQARIVTEFFEKYASKAKPKKVEIGQGYGARIPSQPSALEQSLKNRFPSTNTAAEAQKEIGKYTLSPGVYGNMGKTNLWPKLGY